MTDQRPKPSYELRGDCRAFVASREPEVVLSGPSDCGKTIASCVKAHLICICVPGAQGAIMRKTAASLKGSVVMTFKRIIKDQCVQTLGGEHPERFIYPNGSAIWLGGLDDPGKALSSERDFIYVNQAEELTLNDWEILATRCSGRAAVVKHPQLIGDCNPGGSKHWIRNRAADGKLRLLTARHKDNPTIFTADGRLTEDGAKRIAVLDNLTGVRKKRLRYGIWATAEGAVYDNFDAALHVLKRERSEMKRFFLTMDEGYTNPAVILDVGSDADDRWHVFREFYQRGVLQSAVVATAMEWFKVFGCELAAVDAAAAGLIADLVAAGVYAVGGKGRVLDGIQAIQNRLKVEGDGRPRLTIDPGCTNLINEFESYCWQPDKPKDTPVKDFDHSLDALRYLSDVLGTPTGAFSSAQGVHTGRSEGSERLVFERLGRGDF